MGNLDIVMPDGLQAVSVLGRGAMGTVYKAWQEKLKRHVAVKTCSIKDSEDAGQDLGRLEDEALTIAQLNHPNIVSLIDVVRDDIAIYLIMEFLDGPPLSRLLNPKVTLEELGEYRTTVDTRTGRTIREDWMLEIGLSVAKALSYAHSRNVLHRDIKPANIIITEAMNVKLLDFSIARNISQSEGRTLSGTVFGTVQYMSPEQILSHPMDGRTDIYSLGCTLYHLATGDTVFSDPNEITVCMNHVNTAPKKVQNLNPYLSAETCELIMKCLEKNPKDRYLTAEEMADAIKRILRSIGSGMRFRAISVEEVPRLSVQPTMQGEQTSDHTPQAKAGFQVRSQQHAAQVALNDLETREESPDTGIVQYPVGPGVPIQPGGLTPLPVNGRNQTAQQGPVVDQQTNQQTDQTPEVQRSAEPDSPQPSTVNQPLKPQEPADASVQQSEVEASTPKPKIKPASAGGASSNSIVRTTKPERLKKKVGLEELASRSDEYDSFTGREPTNPDRDTQGSSSQVPGVNSNAYVPVSYSSQLIDHETARENIRASQRKNTIRMVIVVGALVLGTVAYLLFG
ncbi:MAG: serine/threonine protein kinase [Sumerlaeia bacterium]